MCGIVGALSLSPVDPVLIERMRDRLEHRGPDRAGSWRSDDGRIALGHRRLAIVDLRPESDQPFISSDGRFVITFNGEIYNFRQLRKELAARGSEFRTRSDTEVLIEAFRHWGQDCLRRLSGMFAFAIWDRERNRLFCARDRVGEKPFYYTVVNGSFVFASELKAVVLWPGFRRCIDYTALIDYLSFGFVPDPKTIWEGCYKLEPGHSLTVEFAPGAAPKPLKPAAYWDFEFRPDSGERNWTDRILDSLQSAAAEMSFADVPVGTFLSGGVDSSSVTAALSRAGCSVKTFTVGFEEEGSDERPWAREVARLYNTLHTERLVRAENIPLLFEKMLWHYDEPFNDYSYFPTYVVCREARQEITVALSGDGGDELFAGYRKYQRLALRQALDRAVPSALMPAIAAAARLLPGGSASPNRLAQYGAAPECVLRDMLTTAFRTAELRRTARGPLAAALRDYDPLDTVRRLLRNAPPEEVGVVNAMRYLDLKLTLAGDMLVKVDRASMAVSLEVRPVYLHRDMLDVASRIPPHLLAARNCSKKLLKSALSGWLPTSILHRPKMGFALPLGKWIAGDLRQVIRHGDAGLLNDFLDDSLWPDLLRKHEAGVAGLTLRIHSLFFLRNWLAAWDSMPTGTEARS